MSQSSWRSIAPPFILVTLIWGSTWIVIRDQLATVPPSWSVCYRFLLAGVGMALLAAARRMSLRLPLKGILFATVLGLSQFVLNFNFVYRAEHYLTSGVVATAYALLLIPNSLLAWIIFRQPVSRSFILGSLLAIAGITMLLLREYRSAPVTGEAVLLGVALSAAGLLSASTANIMQGMQIARQLPMIPVLAWAMLLGALMDAIYAWATVGPPVVEWRAGYLLGIAWLGIAGSVVSFPLYFRLIQRIGPGRAAYTSVLVPILAMFISTLVEGYRWTMLSVAGAALAIFGMAIALRTKTA